MVSTLKHVIIGYYSYISGRDMTKKKLQILQQFYPCGLYEVVLHVKISKLGYFPLHFKKGLGNVILEFFSVYLSQS